MDDCVSALAALETESQYMATLPRLLTRYDREVVEKAMAKHLSRSQCKECWKRLEARDAQLVWLGSSLSASGSLVELAVVITDRSLNETSRGEWVVSGDVDKDVSDFLMQHCTRGQGTVAGSSLDATVAALRRQMPETARYLSDGPRVDVASHGSRTYAELLGRELLPRSINVSGSAAQPMTVGEFEAAHRRGEGPEVADGALAAARPIDKAEAAIVALGWVRMNLIAPPKAAKYVTRGLMALNALVVWQVVSLFVTTLWAKWNA